MKKLLALLIAAIMLIGAFSAMAEELKLTDEEMTIELWDIATEDPKKSIEESAVLAFMADHPNIHVNITHIMNDTYKQQLMRSVIVVGVSLTLLLMITAFAAYPLSRMRFKLRNFIYAGIIAMMSIPMHVTLIPIFKMTNWMGLYDKLFALLGPYVAFALPMSVFILTGFMTTIPREVEEAAVIDGCNKYSMFFRIILPLSKSGLSTLAIYNGVSMWNEFAFANTLLL